MKQFVVLHDYGTEGWKIVAECDDILQAVRAREADVIWCGGTSLIFEHHETLTAYRMAEYARRTQERP